MSASPTISPYIGLVPYSEKDAPFFFGRDAETEIISANLMASRLTLLYGASGVGKSSVLRAGVVHHLREVAHQNLIEHGSPEFAVVTFSAWRDDPIVGLVNAIQEAVSKAWEGKSFEPIAPSLNLSETLESGAKSAGGELILILDQFEEYFLYHSQEDGTGTFAVEFPRVVNRTNLRASFLISTREDALAKLDRFKGRIPNLFDNYLRIEHLDRDAARDAIVKPLEEYNRRTTADYAVSIEPALIDAVLGQVKAGQVLIGDAGRGVLGAVASGERIETPYLQLVMTRLWDEERRANSKVLRMATLTRLGGAERIVRTHLDAAMNALPSGDQNVASHIFRYLVTPSGTKIAHTAPDLAAYTELPLKQITPCLDKLSGGNVRILRPVAPPPDQPQVARYEIFHDVLAAAILDWRERYERRLQRGRVVTLVSVLGVCSLLLILSLGIYAWNQNQIAQQQALSAQEQASNAQQLSSLLLAADSPSPTPLPIFLPSPTIFGRPSSTFAPIAASPTVNVQATTIAVNLSNVRATAVAIATSAAQVCPVDDTALSSAKKLGWMPINTDGVLYKFAAAQKQGYPRSDEFEFSVGTDSYIGQVYDSTIIYVKKGDWGNLISVPLRPDLQKIAIDPRLAPLGITFVPSLNALWRVSNLQYQDETQSSGNHHIFFTVLDSAGKPMSGVTFVVDYSQDPADPHQPIKVTTDANGQANFPMFANLDISLKNGPYFAYVSDKTRSDVVIGMGLPDRRHVNFLLTFTQSPPDTNPAILAAKKLSWLPYDTSSALYKYAQSNNLGFPQTAEYEFTVCNTTYVGEVFNLGILYAKKGDWGNIKFVKKQ